MRFRDYPVSLFPFPPTTQTPVPWDNSADYFFYLIVATSTINTATEQPYAEALNTIQLVSEREYLEAVCGDWSDYAESEDHQDDEHDQPPKQDNLEENSRSKERKTTPSLMGWVREVYTYFCNKSLLSATLFSTEELDDSSPREWQIQHAPIIRICRNCIYSG